MTKEQRDAEERARVETLAARAKTLFAQGAMSWEWPGSGKEGDPLPRNCFFTGLPVRTKQHANAHKCNFTPLPGCANKRHKKRVHAQSL